MSIFAIAGCVTCGGYWFHAGDDLGYPRWVGAVVSVALYLAMYWVWPGGLLWAVGAQIAAALLVGCAGSVRLMNRR